MTDRYSDNPDATDYYGGEEPPIPEDPNRTGEEHDELSDEVWRDEAEDG